MKGKIVLEDGSIFYGDLIAPVIECGEVVFNTSMSGYQEIITDPSYAKQTIVMSYPLIGNYGVSINESESIKPALAGLVIDQLYEGPLARVDQIPLKDFLIQNKVPTLINVDCRALTLHIRDEGSLKGVICSINEDQSVIEKHLRSYDASQVSREHSTRNIIPSSPENFKYTIGIIDYGMKKSIKESIEKFDAKTIIFPQDISYEELIKYNLDGIVLSNGPGNPEDAHQSFELVKNIQGNIPILGICLGHQILALTNGARTTKMKFGHRGANHSVINLNNEKSFVTAQNHSYCIDEESLKGLNIKTSYLNVNDKTIEGISHNDGHFISVQFHPEANSGPLDTHNVFEDFFELVRRHNEAN